MLALLRGVGLVHERRGRIGGRVFDVGLLRWGGDIRSSGRDWHGEGAERVFLLLLVGDWGVCHSFAAGGAGRLTDRCGRGCGQFAARAGTSMSLANSSRRPRFDSIVAVAQPKPLARGMSWGAGPAATSTGRKREASKLSSTLAGAPPSKGDGAWATPLC